MEKYVLIVWIVVGLIVAFAAINLGWRWLSRVRSLPCPSLLAWSLENPVLQRLNGTRTTLERLELRPGQKVLEIGPGPGRLLLPASQRVMPDGEVVGIDIQPGMLDRLEARAKKAGVTNLTAILGDATKPHVTEGTFDLVFLCTVLGEIPDRAAALKQCYRALKPGGVLAISEMAGDPHYQRRSVVEWLAKQAGFQFKSVQGHWWSYTAKFVKT
jgi:ubiquinone/menaquinone biosynthesis C-methylase UbiE